MASLKSLNKCFRNQRNIKYNKHSFYDIHSATEGYFKRLYFIGLRVNGLQYKNAKILMNRKYMNAVDYLNSSMKNFPAINKNKGFLKDFNILKNLYSNFSVKYRNLLIHREIDNIDESLCKLLIHIDLSLMSEIERIFYLYYKKTPLKNKPIDFGAKRCNSKGQDKIIMKLSSGYEIKNKPMKFDDVKKQLFITKRYKFDI